MINFTAIWSWVTVNVVSMNGYIASLGIAFFILGGAILAIFHRDNLKVKVAQGTGFFFLFCFLAITLLSLSAFYPYSAEFWYSVVGG